MQASCFVKLPPMNPFQDLETPPQLESSGSDWVTVPEPEVKIMIDSHPMLNSLRIAYANIT